MLSELDKLAHEQVDSGVDFPFVLAAGERRRWNANQIYRNPAWRGDDHDGALRAHPEDLEKLGIDDGNRVLCESATNSIEIRVKSDDRMLPGFLSAPHGYGMEYPGNEPGQAGPQIDLLTAADHCDPLAKTPYHKHVPVRLRRVTERS